LAITPLQLAFDNINFQLSVTENLPPIQQIGRISPIIGYTLRLDLRNQNTPTLGAGRDMEYFNNWFFELGTQTFLSQEPSNVSNLIDALTGNAFVLSGQGYYGYYALIENGFTITTTVGAIVNNQITFSQNEGQDILIRSTSGLGNSIFQVNSAIKGQAEVVDNSVNLVPNTEVITLTAPVGNPRNVIMTSDFSLSNIDTFIGAPAFVPNSMNCFMMSGFFPVVLGNFSVSGLTITLPILAGVGDAYGLFQRDFTGLNGNNVNILTIREFNINVTQLANLTVLPFGSNTLININVNGFVPSVPQIVFLNCNFGTGVNDSSSNGFPLDLLVPVGARIQNGIRFRDCTFSYIASTFGGIIGFNINNGAVLGIPTQTALLGSSVIDNTTFGAFGNDSIRLQTNYNGTGDTLSNLILKDNVNLLRVFLDNLATAVPPAISITLDNNPLLNQFIFQNYNMNTLNIIGTLPLVTDMRVDDNNLPSADLDSIIVALDNNGLTNGNLDYSNQTGGASPNIGVSGLAYNNLIAKGWTVTGNVPI